MSDTPEHTCDRIHTPQAGCDGCEHCLVRFGALWTEALRTAAESGMQPATAERDDAFDAVFGELVTLGVAPSVWWHCATIITQLADRPVTVDRLRMWGQTLAEGSFPELPGILDMCDALLTAAGLREQDRAGQVLKQLHGLRLSLQVACHVTLCTMALAAMQEHMTIYQIAAHDVLLRDVRPTFTLAYETLFAARLTGARMAGDADTYQQLLTRARRMGAIGAVAYVWTCGVAQLTPDPDTVGIVYTVDGKPESMINTRAAVEAADDYDAQGFILAARVIRACAGRDVASPAADADTLGQLAKLLAEDPHRSGHMFDALSMWYAQLLDRIYGERIREQLAHEHNGEVTP